VGTNGPLLATTQQQRRSKRARREMHETDGPPRGRSSSASTPKENILSRQASVRGEDSAAVDGDPLAGEPPLKQQAVGDRAPWRKGRVAKDAAKAAATPAAQCTPAGAPDVKQEPGSEAAVEHRPTNGSLVPLDVGDSEPACSAEEQWATLNNALDVLAIAPDDEVVAEIISLQAELLQVRGVVRRPRSAWKTARCVLESCGVSAAQHCACRRHCCVCR
jgi:hypothetical protein